MKPRLLLLALAVALATVVRAAPADSRFSQALAVSERAEIGFNRLSSDQVASLDALVRRDLATQTSSTRRNDPAPPVRFSQRLTADERTVAGLTLFNEKELARLDELVAQTNAGAIARALLAPPVFYPTGMRLRPIEPTTPRAPEIHGSFTLSYGFGKGGYSEKAGGMTLNYEDPKHNLAVSFSYWESHVKGGAPYRNDYPLDSYIGAAPFVP